jgi:two-component system chemotaxis response regulator CheY
MRILLVDDSRMVRQIVRRTLVESGRPEEDLLEAPDGVEALRVLRDDPQGVDLLLLDWNMPRLDGVGFLREVRALPGIGEVAVVMVTSQAQPANVAEAVKLGVRDFVVKPFTPDVLLQKIRRVEDRLEEERSRETSIMLRAVAGATKTDPKVPFFAQVPSDVMEEFEALSRRLTVPAGRPLLLPHQTVQALHLVAQGEVEIQPGGERIGAGGTYGEASLITGMPAGITVTAATQVEVLSLTRLQLGEAVRRHPRVTWYLAGLVSRRAARPEASEAGLTGRLETMSVPELVQLLHMCRKTGHLRLRRGELKAGLYFADGELSHAYAGNGAGEEAFYDLVTWTDAEFAFESGRRGEGAALAAPTMSLLLEGMRRADERRKPRTT